MDVGSNPGIFFLKLVFMYHTYVKNVFLLFSVLQHVVSVKSSSLLLHSI